MEFVKEIGGSIYDIADELWSEGAKTFNRLSTSDQEAVIEAMDDFYPEKESIDISKLNDILWFDFDMVAPYCSDLIGEIDRELSDLEDEIENLQDKLDDIEDELYEQFGDDFEPYDSNKYSELEDEKTTKEALLDELQGLKDKEEYEELAFRLNIW